MRNSRNVLVIVTFVLLVASSAAVLGSSSRAASASPTPSYGWTETSALPGGSGNNVLIACPTTGFCWGTTGYWNEQEGAPTGGKSYVLSTSDYGTDWTNYAIGEVEESSAGLNPVSDNQPLQPTAVTCVPNSDQCFYAAWAPQVYPSQYVPEEFEYIGSSSDSTPDDLGALVTNVSSHYQGDAISMNGLNDLTCPSVNTCSDVGALGYYNSNTSFTSPVQQLFQGPSGGGNWTAVSPVLSGGYTDLDVTAKSVTCTSTTLCWLAGSVDGAPVIDVSTQSSWTPTGVPDTAGTIDYIKCVPGANPSDAAEASCYALAYDDGWELAHSADGGATWTIGRTVGANNEPFILNASLKGLTCPSASVCFAYGEGDEGTGNGELLLTTDSGATWTPETIPGSTVISSVSCPSMTECYLGAGMSDTAGAVWTTTDLGLSQAPTEPVTDLVATGGLDSVSASWTSPDPTANFGRGAPFTDLLVTATPVNADDVATGPGTTYDLGANSTSTSFGGLTPGVTYDVDVVAQDTVDGSVVSTGVATDALAVPTTATETSTSTTTGSNPSTTSAKSGGATISTSSIGSGTVSVGQYSTDPEAGLSAGSTYFDVAATGSFTSVAINECSPHVALPLQWWNPSDGAWEDVSPSATISSGCLDWTANDSSTPTVSELYGTPFSAAAVQAPSAPRITSATGANSSASITWVAPGSNGGSKITKYVVTSAPGNKSCSTTSTKCAVADLTNGAKYTFTVVAKNAVGTSRKSAASPIVVPGKHGPAAITLVVSGKHKVGVHLVITASVASGVRGTIAIGDTTGALCTAKAIVRSKVSCTWTPTIAGSTTVIASYGGSAAWASSSKTQAIAIKPV